MRGDEELARHLPPERRHAYLDADAVRRLVEAVRPGLLVAANLERYKDGWRLRITLNRSIGGVTRRSVTLPDDDTASWVREHLMQARAEWREQRADHGIKQAGDGGVEHPPTQTQGTV